MKTSGANFRGRFGLIQGGGKELRIAKGRSREPAVRFAGEIKPRGV